MNKLANFLQHVTIGEPQAHNNLRIYPLHLRNGHQRGYRTLDEAMEAGEIEITEVSESGSVPTLTVHNHGQQPVLLTVGEQLVGAKQNRVLNTSLLVAAESALAIPVSCVERGRWAYQSTAFRSSDTTSHLRLRKAQLENVTTNLRQRAVYDANQREVWAEVDRKIASHQSDSRTAALADVYTQTETLLKPYLDAFTLPDGQGVLVEIGGRVVGADLFDHEDTLRRLWPKLMRGYALDALERSGDSAAPSEGTQPIASDTFLSTAAAASEESYASVGLGEDVRLSDPRVNGSGLLWDGRQLIHAALFSAEA